MSLDLWNRLSQPPASALKTIQAGRLKGKSDINPQWRMKALTEELGPCGLCWKYVIDRLWTEPGIDGQIFAFSQVSLYWRENSASPWSDAIPGIGGSMLIDLESRGLHLNDEAYKMATTDALSVAMKALGVAADIYLGLFDGSKYQNPKDGIKAALPSAHKANDGAGDNLDNDQKNRIADLAVAIKDTWEIDSFDAMFDLYLEVKDNEEKRFLWSLLDSPIKTKITAIGNAKKGNKNGV